jgi:hypothetical protein
MNRIPSSLPVFRRFSVDRLHTLRLAASGSSEAQRAALVQGRRCEDQDASAAVSFRESVPRSFGRRWILADRSQQKASHTRRTVIDFRVMGRADIYVLTSERQRTRRSAFTGRCGGCISDQQQTRQTNAELRCGAAMVLGTKEVLRPAAPAPTWRYNGRVLETTPAAKRVARERDYRLLS